MTFHNDSSAQGKPSHPVSVLRSWRADIARMLPPPEAPFVKRLLAFLETQGVWAVTIFRFGTWLRQRPRIVRVMLAPIYRPLRLFVECITGIQIPSSVRAGPGLYIGHFGCIILNGDVVLGNDVNLSQQVTIGVSGVGESRGVPVVGSRVYLGPGAKVFGPISIGDDCIIGANAVVNRSLPAGSVAVGVPARVIRRVRPEEIRAIIYGNSG